MRRQVLMMVAVGMTTITLAWSTPARAANEAEVAEHLIELVKIGRAVVSEHQATINDAAKAEKGFTADFVADQVMAQFKKKTKIDLRIPNVVPKPTSISPWWKRREKWSTRRSRSSIDRSRLQGLSSCRVRPPRRRTFL